jgi:zinc and cadmium transporter
MHYLLAFSGSFLLSITFLHLLPETFRPVFSMEVNTRAGIYLLIGFFIQLLIQRFTHGVEHGHAHVHPHEHHIPLVPIIAGLTVHAFMEGLPLGFNYLANGTEPSLYLAVGVHKLPEAMLVTSLVLAVKGRQKAWLALIYFSLITPVAAMLAQVLGQQYLFISQAVVVLIPIVAGAFIHIATTIFFESGTKQHMLSWQKIAAMIVGVGLALGTLYFE